jgi:hypothetical protein
MYYYYDFRVKRMPKVACRSRLEHNNRTAVQPSLDHTGEPALGGTASAARQTHFSSTGPASIKKSMADVRKAEAIARDLMMIHDTSIF